MSVDLTPDITNLDQFTIVFRYVLPDGPVERFDKFILVRGHNSNQLAEVLLRFLEDKEISLKDLRGKSYDNAFNMSGKYKGMQAIIKTHNHLAEYILCVAHSLNLVGKCIAKCCQTAVRFLCLFGVSMRSFQVQRIGRISLLMYRKHFTCEQSRHCLIHVGRRGMMPYMR